MKIISFIILISIAMQQLTVRVELSTGMHLQDKFMTLTSQTTLHFMEVLYILEDTLPTVRLLM